MLNIIQKVALELPETLENNPSDLKAIFEGFQDSVVRHLNIEDLPNKDLSVNLFDLTFISRGFRVRTDVDETASFASKLKVLGCFANQRPYVTYDGLISTNSRFKHDEIRTFTGLESEKQFYIGHQIIEEIFDQIMYLLQDDLFEDLRVNRVCELLKEVYTSGFDYIIDNVPVDDFNQFRPFFTTLNGVSGPSALYSPSMPCLENVLYGSEAESVRFYHANEQYYSPSVRSNMNLETISLSSDNLKKISQEILNFRARHYGKLIRHYLPTVVEGSAGTQIKEFIRTRVADNKSRIS